MQQNGKHGAAKAPALYRPEPKTLRMKFLDTEYEGLEVVTRLSLPIRLVIDLQNIAKDEERQMEAFAVFGDKVLLEWNMAGEDGKLLPATAEGFQECDMALGNAIITQWAEAMQAPKAPLSGPSSDGGTLLAGLMPMEPL